MTIDLHCHSCVSDGIYTPTQLIRLAKENKVDMLALTDHDHTGGLEEARAAAKDEGIRFINGVEISVTWRQRTIHIVGLNFEDKNPDMINALEKNRRGRIDRLRAYAEALEEKAGMKGVFEGAMAHAKNPEMVGRAHIAKFLLEEGLITTKQEVFTRWIGEGKPAYVHHEWMSLEDAVSLITEAGGIAVIAHPARYKLSGGAMRELIETFKGFGGQGIEIACSCHSLNERLELALLAGKYGLYASVGSDFHGSENFDKKPGKTPELPPLCKPIWNLFD